ncbi:MAG: patatin-like phospholipase family protein [Rhodospirillaceae bacterium]|nr:patatin-like phospholipase family protein [Rhodospirillaceae bacterium]
MTRPRFSAVVALFLLAACTTPRTEVPSAYVPYGAMRLDSAQTVFFNDRPLPPDPIAADHTGDGQIVIVALSGGGSHGAFGAGVLNGWTESGARPPADVVTGVSAGALLATYAFLGPAYDAKAEEIYASITNKRVYERRDFISIPFSPSFVSQKPLRDLMESLMTDEVLDAVAKERRDKGRRLLVASTDLDNSRVVTWDLTALANSTRPDRRARYVNAIMASSAIPGFFEPVMISPDPDTPGKNAQMHVDGSMSTSIFVPSLIGADDKLPLKVYAVVNSQLLEERSDKLLEPNTIDILEAAVMKMMRTVLQRSLYDAYLATMFVGGEFYMIGMPEDRELATNQLKFKPEVSAKLLGLGRSIARGNGWKTELPRFDSLVTQVQSNELLKGLRPARPRPAAAQPKPK